MNYKYELLERNKKHIIDINIRASYNSTPKYSSIDNNKNKIIKCYKIWVYNTFLNNK